MKRLALILFLLSIATALAVPVLAAGEEKGKNVQQVAAAMGRVVKVGEGSITIKIRAMMRRGKAVSEEKEITFKVNADTRFQQGEGGGQEAKITDITLDAIKVGSLVTVNKAADSDTASLVVMARRSKKEKKEPPQPAANGRFNIPYGEHKRQVLDFYPAKSGKPTPVVFHIHGGAWVSFDKSMPADVVKFYNEQGVSVVSINYRFIKHAVRENVEPPVKAPLMDAARALQFVRSKAEEWNIDKKRIVAGGGSSGGCSALWLAMHDDMADPDSQDPVARESTRLYCAVGLAAQTSLDPKELLEWMPNTIYGAHALVAGATPFDRRSGGKEFAAFAEKREELLPWIKEYSPAALASKDDPPMTLFYPGAKKGAEPPKKGDCVHDPTHCVLHGFLLQEKFKALGVDLRVEQWPGSVRSTIPEWQDRMNQTVVDYLNK